MGHLGTADVAMGSGEAAPMANHRATLKVGDRFGLETVFRIYCAHHLVHDRFEASKTKRSQGAVLGQYAGGVHDLRCHSRGQRIPAAHGLVILRLRCDDRSPHLVISDDRVEVARSARYSRDVGAIRPERQCALDQGHRIHRACQQTAAVRSGQGSRDHDAAEAMAHQMESHVPIHPRSLLEIAQQRESGGLAKLVGESLHLPERQGPQRRQQATQSDTAEADRFFLGLAVHPLGVERFAVGPRRGPLALAAQCRLAIKHFFDDYGPSLQNAREHGFEEELIAVKLAARDLARGYRKQILEIATPDEVRRALSEERDVIFAIVESCAERIVQLAADGQPYHNADPYVKEFFVLYWGEMGLVEGKQVKAAMVQFGATLNRIHQRIADKVRAAKSFLKDPDVLKRLTNRQAMPQCYDELRSVTKYELGLEDVATATVDKREEFSQLREDLDALKRCWPPSGISLERPLDAAH